MQNDKDKFKKEFQERLIQFSVDIVHFCSRLREARNLYPLSDQLIRSATSIGANVVEAKAASSRRDYTRFFEIACKSANETVYWLTILERSEPTFSIESKKLGGEATELAKILGSAILTLKNKK